MLISERVFVLKNVSIFSRTDEQVLRKIAEALTEVSIEANQAVFHKGDEGKSMYIILSGSVKVHNDEHIFATLTRKQVFGEYALLDTEERSASVTALEPTKLLMLDQKTFYEIMIKHIEILQGILQVLVVRSRLSLKLQEELVKEKETIQAQSLELKMRHEEILSQTEEILQQQEQISAQNEMLQEKTTLITSSINYAQTIQEALLPDMELFKKLLPQSFVYYQPKDIVSGDFYWLSDLTSKVDNNNTKLMLACVDCTGHGVPGAFMSFLGTTYLNQIVDFQGIIDVSEVLTELNKNIRKALKQEIQDGMDMIICLIDKEKRIVEFASARSHFFYITHYPHSKPEINIIRGDTSPIGGRSPEIRFNKYIIPYNEYTTFYLSTDGYRDQFGHRTNRKFMMKTFKELFLNIYHLPMDEQLRIIKNTHEEWKGFLPQTDDVLVIGFKVS